MIGIDTDMAATAFAFEDREAVTAALGRFDAGSCGFGDCLVVAKPARQRCDFTATCDRGLRKRPGIEVL